MYAACITKTLTFPKTVQKQREIHVANAAPRNTRSSVNNPTYYVNVENSSGYTYTYEFINCNDQIFDSALFTLGAHTKTRGLWQFRFDY